MKHKLLYLLPLLLIFIAGCVPHDASAPSAANVPDGTYTGEFELIHLNTKTGIIDTPEKVPNLVLKMEPATGFTVTGDTTTYHAGSYGAFVVSSSTSQVEFYDKTYPANGITTKVHLDGIYNYTDDGTNLQLGTSDAADTLEYFYKLVRTGN
jgi:hypothetical protein